jgi:protocatechuate 3,4-dioxygenase beta subunit
LKTSNLLLGLWALLVAGLALVAVYFLRTGDSGNTSGANPATGVTPGTGDAAGSKPPKPTQKPPRAGGDKTTPRPAPQVTGRVVDGTGKAVEGAVVRLLPPAKPSAAPSGVDGAEIKRIAHIVTVFEEDWDRLRPLALWSEAPPADPNRAAGPEVGSATTDGEGKFLFQLAQGAGRGPYRLSVRVASIGSASAANVFAGQDVELMLSTGGVVTGTVVGESDGKPVADAKVVFDSGDKEYPAATDETGTFRIESMPPGRYTVRAGAKGRTPLLDQAVQVVRGEPVKLQLPRGATLRIKTVLMDGSAARGAEPPIPQVEVIALEETTLVYVTGKSNDYGLVEFPGLPSGQWIVNGRVDKFVSQGDTVVKLEPNKEVVEDELSFEPAVLTPLEVVDDTGAPVAGVEFYTGDGNDTYDVLRSDRIPGTTDNDGKFSYPFEFDGPRCMIFGFRKGLGMVYAYPDDYSAGEPVKLVMRKAVRVFGKITDEQGTGVPDALVRFTIDLGTSEPGSFTDTITVQLRTDTSGKYDFPHVPEGSEVTVEAETEDAWSDDMPTVETADGKREYEVNLRLEAAPAPRVVETGGQKLPLTPK